MQKKRKDLTMVLRYSYAKKEDKQRIPVVLRWCDFWISAPQDRVDLGGTE